MVKEAVRVDVEHVFELVPFVELLRQHRRPRTDSPS